MWYMRRDSPPYLRPMTIFVKKIKDHAEEARPDSEHIWRSLKWHHLSQPANGGKNPKSREENANESRQIEEKDSERIHVAFPRRINVMKKNDEPISLACTTNLRIKTKKQINETILQHKAKYYKCTKRDPFKTKRQRSTLPSNHVL